ncbi:ribonuclease P protein component [Caviibacter abscessus]|uniref:ribonuclease P protein component n=1 Tax=Caviibacter abscessus TaxID=1766719 RepID=UPI00082C90D7|nr:ribonuclease P protein component [Caviibacter abscessus]
MESLKKKKEFNFLYTKGKKVYTKYTIIFITNKIENKVGVVASKKVGNAVKRNRIKRIFRQVVRNNPNFFDICKSYVIIASKNCKEDFNELNYSVLEKDILNGVKKYEKFINNTNQNISKINSI